MKAEFSEFTYGFSLVNELAKTLPCTAVPIFPSLFEEGKKGGGYDVELLLSKKGKLLYLQFKLSDRMKTSNAREYKISGHSLSLPYYRFEVTSKQISKQHSLLLSLEENQPLTFYAAPAFYLKKDINTYWSSDSVTRNSVFVKPSSIRDLPDLNPHRVCFNDASIEKKQAYLFSEPQEIEVFSFRSFSEFVISEVAKETDTLRSSIERACKEYSTVIKDAYQRELGRSLLQDLPPEHNRDLLSLEEILSDSANERDLLRQVAQVSSGIFGAQAIAVVKE